MYGGRQESNDHGTEFRSISSKPAWEVFLPDDDLDAKARSVFFLRSVEQNPVMMKAMLTHSWDGRKRDLRNVLNAAIKPLDEMLQTQNDPNSLPFEKTVIALRKTRAETGRLRTLERKATKNVICLEKEKKDWIKIHKQCVTNLERINADLPKCTDAQVACRTSANLLERNSETMKQALTDQAMDLLQNYAGIDMNGSDRLTTDGDDGEADRQDVLLCLDRPEEPTRSRQIDTDLSRARSWHDRDLIQVLQTRDVVQDKPTEAPAGKKGHKTPKMAYRSKAQRLQFLKEIHATAYHSTEQKLQVWEELHAMMYSYDEDPEVDMPDILKQPDGGDPNDLDSTWWGRFRVFWDDHVSRFFSGRDHKAAAAWLTEWKILVQQQDDQDEAQQEAIDNAAMIANRTAMICQTVQAMLDQGSFSQPEEVLFLNTFLHGSVQDQDFEALDQVLLMSTQQQQQQQQQEEEEAAAEEEAVIESSLSSQPAAAAAAVVPFCFTTAVFSETTFVGVWTQKLAIAVDTDRISSLNAGALQLMVHKYLGLIWTRNKNDAFRKRLKHYEWATGCLGYLISFLCSVHSTDYLVLSKRLSSAGRLLPSRIDRLGASREPDILKRRQRYLCYSEQLALLCKYYSTERHRPVPSTKKKALAPWGNVFHRDSWIVDFPICDLATALEPGGAKAAGIAGSWDYTMGGWLCLRCCEPLSSLRGDCSCLCFRGHRRTECARPGSGCYGFHPCRFMECMALGLPSTTQGKTETISHSYEKRVWTHRQRRYRWREFVKEIVQGRDPWFGVVPEEKRGSDMSTWVTEDLSELLQDWFVNLDWERFQGLIDDADRVRTRLDKIAKFHLDLLLDDSKYLPDKLNLYAPNQNKSPNWRWIDYGCPICSVWMEVNKSNTCRGLCNGCRAWQSILGPEKKYIASGAPYNVFERDGGLGKGKRKRSRKRNRVRNKPAVAARRTITLLPMTTSVALLAAQPTYIRRNPVCILPNIHASAPQPRRRRSRRDTRPSVQRRRRSRRDTRKKKSKREPRETAAAVVVESGSHDTLLDSGKVHPLFSSSKQHEIPGHQQSPPLPQLFTDPWIQPLSVPMKTASLFNTMPHVAPHITKADSDMFDAWMEPLSVPLKSAALFMSPPPIPTPRMPTLFDSWVTQKRLQPPLSIPKNRFPTLFDTWILNP